MSSEQGVVGSNPTGCTISFMQKYVLVQLLQPVPENTEFSMQDWPLHVTISPRFAVDWEASNLSDRLSRLLRDMPAIQATAGDDAHFGANGEVHVTLVNMTPALQSLHDKVLAVLHDAGAVFDEIEYTGQNYRAHATVQNGGRLHKGDAIMIDRLTLIDMFPHQDIKQRKVLGSFQLAG